MRLAPRWFLFVYGCDRLANVCPSFPSGKSIVRKLKEFQLARRSFENYRRNPGQISLRKDCLGPMLNAKEEGSDKVLPLESVVSETMVFL